LELNRFQAIKLMMATHTTTQVTKDPQPPALSSGAASLGAAVAAFAVSGD
jgi:hypothetical protein